MYICFETEDKLNCVMIVSLFSSSHFLQGFESYLSNLLRGGVRKTFLVGIIIYTADGVQPHYQKKRFST